MDIKIIKTRTFQPPRDNLWTLLKESIDVIHENSIICITSKIVSIGEGRCISIEDTPSKDKLVINDVEYYLPREGRLHTINKGILVGSGGVDESNANGFYILWPKNPQNSAKRIWKFLRKEYSVKKLGIIITDSNAVPLKRGVVGQAIAYYGFLHIRNYVGKKDIFGRKLRFTRSNIPDSLAAFAVFLMGEASERTPIVIFENLPNLKYVKRPPHFKKRYTSWKVPMDEDIFRHFWRAVHWRRGGS